MIILVKSQPIALHCLQLNAVAVFPHSFQDIAVLQLDLSLAMELAILEISNVNPAVLFAPLHPLVFSWPIYHIVVEVAGQSSSLSMKRAVSLLFAVEELTSIADIGISSLVVSETMHATVRKLATIDLT